MAERGRTQGRGIVAVDAAAVSRPGVPRERSGPDAGARWERPEQQRGVDSLSREGLRSATPVFGTAQPASGLSGLVRRAAYRLPEHRSARWALLLVGDRVDVLEHRVARNLWLIPAAAALAAGYLAVSRSAGRR
ncbi:MAG TPA: hypothetical protein VF894_05710 [Anaeromyxobacter sp.]